MERAALLCRGEMVLPEHLPARLAANAAHSPGPVSHDTERLEDIERQTILRALKEHDFNRTETAKALGISRRTLVYRLQHFRALGLPVDAE
jgi:DNA-binding NtrC family response regulator